MTPSSDDVQEVAYGDGPAQRGWLHRPGGASRGTVVVLHGGFWRAAYDAGLGEPLARDLAGRGWTAWNLEYRRVGSGPGGGGGFPATLDDVAAGIDALADLGVDLTSVITLGHSAGGHLAAWAAARTRFERWGGGVAVTHVVAQGGVLDLVSACEEHLGDGAAAAFMGGPPSEEWRLADPAQQLPLDQPVRCVHARDDDVVPIGQAEDYVARARAAGADATLIEVPGGHFGHGDPDSTAWARTLAVLEDLPRSRPVRDRR